MRFFAGPTPNVMDDLGYLPLPAEDASALFQVIDHHYPKTAKLTTTNQTVGAQGEILGGTTVDRAFCPLCNDVAASDELRRVTTGTNLRQPKPRPGELS